MVKPVRYDCSDPVVYGPNLSALRLDLFEHTCEGNVTASLPRIPTVNESSSSGEPEALDLRLSISADQLQSPRLDLISETFRFAGMPLSVRILRFDWDDEDHLLPRDYQLKMDPANIVRGSLAVVLYRRAAISSNGACASSFNATWKLYGQRADVPDKEFPPNKVCFYAEPVSGGDLSMYSIGDRLISCHHLSGDDCVYVSPSGWVAIGLRLEE